MDGYKFLALIKAILLAVSFFIGVAAAFMPFWFILSVKISWDGGRTMQDKNLDLGIFFMEQGKIPMIDIMLVEKASNANTLPPMYRVGQIFYSVGLCGMFVCMVASIVYFLRKYKSMAGEMCLAAGLLPSSISLLLGVVFVLLAGILPSDHAWEELPVPNNFHIVEAYPGIAINFGLYIAAFAAIVGIVGMIIAWGQALCLCRHVENVRYQMLHAPLSDDERMGSGGGDLVGHSYAPRRQGYRYDDYRKPGSEVEF